MAKGGKKHHIGLIILITFLTVFLVIPVGFVFLFVYDTNSKDLSKVTKIESPTELIPYVMNDAFTETSKTGKISIKITEDEVNGLLKGVTEKINIQEYVPQVYLEVDKTNYRFYFDVQASFFKTRVGLDTELNIEQIDGEDYLMFKINNIILGKTSFLMPLVKWIASTTNLINDEKINSMMEFGDFSINLKSDLENNRLLYKVDDLKSDLNKLIKTFVSDDNMFFTILTQLIDDPGFITTNFDGAISIDFNLGTIAKNTTYTYTSPLDLKLTDHAEDLETLLNAGVISKDGSNSLTLNDMMTFLIKGKKYCSEEIYNKVLTAKDDIKTKTGIDVENYYGDDAFNDEKTESKVITEGELNTIFINDITQAKTKILSEKEVDVITLDTATLHKFLKSQDFIGYSTFITPTIDDKTDVHFITMDNLYTGIQMTNDSEGKIEFYANLNVDGYQTTMVFVTTPIMDTTNFNVSFGIDEFYLGDFKFNESLTQTLLELFGQCIPQTSTGLFYFDSTKKAFIFDINKATGGIIVPALLNLGTPSIKYEKHAETETEYDDKLILHVTKKVN